MILGVVLAVMAGLLAMHALSTGHTGHSGVGSSDHHASPHGHSGDHHEADERPGPAIPAQSGPETSVARQATATVARFAMASESGARSVIEAASMAPGALGSENTGHEQCLGATPGHCPHLPTLMSMCQAILGSAGGILLLFLLMLALVGQRTAWATLLAVGALMRAPHGEWSVWRRRRRADGPSLRELCIIRI
jgi:hypothetical protein